MRNCFLRGFRLVEGNSANDCYFHLKVFADDNFELYKNGRKYSKRKENTVGK